MKKLAITLVALQSLSAIALERTTDEVSIAVNRVGAFQPAVTVKQASAEAKPMSIKTDGKVDISRRSSAKINRSEEKASLLVSKQLDNAGERKQRATRPATSKAFGFSFYSANSYFNVDLDGDGYYSDFSISFDADYTNGSANVYAVIYTSKNGEPWTELLETGVFNIFSNDAGDEQTVTTQLNFDFPTNEYDILIDLYEDGIPGIVATISSEQTVNLSRLPLEDLEHERSSNLSEISYAATSLFGDSDGDGFYTNLTLEYDISTLYSGDIVYAEIVLINQYAGWSQYLSTDDFILGNQTEFVDLAFNSGYPAGWYDMRINLYNSYTGERIATAGSGFLSLVSLPIESFNNDNFFDVPHQDGGVDIIIEGGGSIGLYLLVMLGLLSLGRHRRLAINLKD